MLSACQAQPSVNRKVVMFPARCALQDKTSSIPDLELVGHTDDAEFALGMCSSEPLVASGGKDKNVSCCLCFALYESIA